jgi:hypothetical protein
MAWSSLKLVKRITRRVEASQKGLQCYPSSVKVISGEYDLLIRFAKTVLYLMRRK